MTTWGVFDVVVVDPVEAVVVVLEGAAAAAVPDDRRSAIMQTLTALVQRDVRLRERRDSVRVELITAPWGENGSRTVPVQASSDAKLLPTLYTKILRCVWTNRVAEARRSVCIWSWFSRRSSAQSIRRVVSTRSSRC